MNPKQTLSLLFPILCLTACNVNLSSRTIVTAEAPDSDVEIEVVSGLPSSSFGPHPVRVYVSNDQKRDLLIRTPVFNDGKPLKKSNAKVSFDGDSVSICLIGTSTPGKLVTFNTATKNYQVQEGSCEA